MSIKKKERTKTVENDKVIYYIKERRKERAKKKEQKRER